MFHLKTSLSNLLVFPTPNSKRSPVTSTPIIDQASDEHLGNI